MANYLKIIIFCLVFINMECLTSSRDITERITVFDHRFFRKLFHMFRDRIFRSVGKTGARVKGQFLQEPYPPDAPFPCDLSMPRSKERPTSVHKLRPGDIDVIAAVGDSLTAASGASSQDFFNLFMENRGLSWSIGGQWDWRNVTTLPNILKMYNPKLVGYSYGDAFPFHWDSQFNIAEIGAVSYDLPFMAKAIVQRIKNDKRVNFRKDWKLLTITIGGNDHCTFVCAMSDPDSLPRKHRQRMLIALRYLRDHLPRTFVNVVSVPTVATVIGLKSKKNECKTLHIAECSCWAGSRHSVSQKQWGRIQREFNQAEEEVAKLKEFQGLNEFAVVYQPLTRNLSTDIYGVGEDLSLLAFDCFHMSQKGNAYAGTTLWNNILQREGNKSTNWESPFKKFLCPTLDHPYLLTYDNS